MTIPRQLSGKIIDALMHSGKVVIVFGPRQVGKTTLIKSIISENFPDSTMLNGEEKIVHDFFSSASLSKMMEATGNRKLLFIDEAQNIPEIGKNIKILHDARPDIKIILSGSSSFELANKTQEPLTGRKRVFYLYPVSVREWLDQGYTRMEFREQMDLILRFGLYPEVVEEHNVAEKETIIRELATSYLYKDIIQLTGIKHSQKIDDLLRLLALQTGSTVSINKLSNALNLSTQTVEQYINLLEQTFVVYRVKGFSRNLSKEISKMDKIYFYDPGIRNAVLGNFIPIQYRHDSGPVWENFLITERRKKIAYESIYANTYFWRTYTGAEIDYVEEREGKIHGYEIKFNNKIVKTPQSWTENYNDASFDTINLENFFEFVM